MADVAKPPAGGAAKGTSTAEKPHKAKPEKPDEEKFKADLAKAEKEHAVVQEKFNALKAKLDVAKPQKDSPTAKRQQELRAQLATIRQQQSSFKSSRGNVQEKIASLDAQLKSRIAEQKTARGRVPFKTVDELDREVQRLEKQVDTGKMKLVDEKKTLAEISSLRKQRKLFTSFDESQKGIEEVKAQISDLRKGMDNPEAKALGEKYNTIAKELDEIKAEQDDAYKSINSLRDERTKLHEEQQAKYTAMREIKDNYYKARNAYRDYEQEQWKARKEKQKVENDAYHAEKRRKVAAQKLEEASEPAYLDEILTAEGLIRYFDPSTPAEQRVLRAPSGMAAEAQRIIDDSSIKGTKVSKKEDKDETYFMGTGGKKGKKGKKGGNGPSTTSAAPTEGKFSLGMGVIEELAKVNVEPPMNQSDVPSVVEKLKEKLAQWKKDQEKKTKENVAKAQAEIDRLEAEASEAPSTTKKSHDTGKKPTFANSGVNEGISVKAQHEQEKDGAADAAEELKKASIEDKDDE